MDIEAKIKELEQLVDRIVKNYECLEKLRLKQMMIHNKLKQLEEI